MEFSYKNRILQESNKYIFIPHEYNLEAGTERILPIFSVSLYNLFD